MLADVVTPGAHSMLAEMFVTLFAAKFAVAFTVLPLGLLNTRLRHDRDDVAGGRMVTL
jgi:hypothetical protein